MTERSAEGIRLRLAAVSACTVALPMLAFGALLRGLEPEAVSIGFSIGRMLVQVAVACAVGAVLAHWLATGALEALADPERPAVPGLDAARRLPASFAAGCFGVWMVAALVGLLAEPAARGAALGVGSRLIAYAAVGLFAAAANLLLAARVMAPACAALARRTTHDAAAGIGAPLSLAGSLRLGVAALVVSPALLDGLLDHSRALASGLSGPGVESVLLPLGVLVMGMGMVELVASALRRDAASLRDCARGAVSGGAGVAHTEAELTEATRALGGLASAVRGVVGAFETAAADLVGGLAELDAARTAVGEMTDAQVADVQRLTESVGSVYSHSQDIDTQVQELRMAVDESSSAITELGASGEQLATTAGELLRSAETAATSIQQALSSLGEVAGSTDVLAGVAGEASSSMEEMAASMREVNESAEQCSDLSDQVVRVADEGSQVVQETIDGMQAIREATKTAEEVIRGLGDRAGEIGAIVGVIDGVANETSLLALNAAIIAAQAGEHGRGFSVVAGEIRELATRVSSSTSEITDLIRSVQDESANAIGAIERGAQSVDTGVELSEQAGRSLIEITRVARSNKKLVEGIVHSVSEQTKAAGHVVGVIEEVSAQAERIRAAAREQEQGSGTVLERARAMMEMAQQVHHTADEQSRGTRVIVRTVESIVAGLDKIGEAVKEQTESCQTVVASTWDAFRRAKDTKDGAGRLAAVTDRLRSVAEASRRVVRDLWGGNPRG